MVKIFEATNGTYVNYTYKNICTIDFEVNCTQILLFFRSPTLIFDETNRNRELGCQRVVKKNSGSHNYNFFYEL